ncbi:hypothetical protein GCM10011611_36040 [Aliidongia dinghuensis]|uniref:Aspartyl beta-hydroxylase n=1 Tax=Aliidongia dinghuensis TaxID=1867774 RepID=A0A8J2YW72_9PROT|nr:hypothetical protein [Aliidongia dinghuensis]GGF26809.1 hypothetical protein GCM10011611_36040 [Aliidongia dinghuensis]
MSVDLVPLDGCVPLRTRWQAGEPWIDWCHLGTARFGEPFFEETIGAQLRKPANLLFQPRTPLAVAEAWLVRDPPVPPTGFVFHMSRCGSTLMSQMLAASPRHVAISEAIPIDTVLRPDLNPADLDDETRIRLLRAVVGGLGQRRVGDEERLFIKFDCWHVLDLALIRRAFPTVPWLFLYREPIEVLVSQLKRRGVQTVPGMMPPQVFGIDFAAAVAMPPTDYCAQVLAQMCRAALVQCQGGEGLLVNYAELPEALWTKVPAHFAVDWTPGERAAMAEVLKVDSKSPSFAFVPDAEEKQRLAPEPARLAAARWLEPVYRELEALRFGVPAPSAFASLA